MTGKATVELTHYIYPAASIESALAAYSRHLRVNNSQATADTTTLQVAWDPADELVLNEFLNYLLDISSSTESGFV